MLCIFPTPPSRNSKSLLFIEFATIELTVICRIIRAIFIVPSFALISFLCVWLDGSPGPYLAPGLDLAEALPMASFFLLITTFVVPNENNRASFFAQLELIDKHGNSTGESSLKWYRVRYSLN
jgi:hypothetical protein